MIVPLSASTVVSSFDAHSPYNAGYHHIIKSVSDSTLFAKSLRSLNDDDEKYKPPMYEYPKAVIAVPVTVTVVDAKLQVAKRRRNSIEDLPSEIAVRIFSWLDMKTLLTAAKVSKRWKRLAFDGSLWTRIDVTRFYSSISPRRLQDLAVYAGGFLKVADFRGCTHLTNHTVAVFADNCPNMETARFAGCRTISRGVLTRLLQINQRLKNLDISGLKIINDETMITIAQYNQRLEALNISHCSNVTGRGISLVMRWCVRLRELHMAQCTRVDKNAMKWIGHLKRLEKLNLAYCPLIKDEPLPSGLAPLATITTLTHLNLNGHRTLTDTILTEITKSNPHLHTLELSGCHHLTDASLAHLARHCHTLTRLDLEECSQTTDTTLQSLSSSPCSTTLEILILSYCDNVTDAGLRTLMTHCTALRKIELDNCHHVTNAFLSSLSNHRPSTLTDLEMYDCRGITQEGVKLFRKRLHQEIERSERTYKAVEACRKEGVSVLPVDMRVGGGGRWGAAAPAAEEEGGGVGRVKMVRIRSFYQLDRDMLPEGGMGRRGGCVIL
ncbi:hypothetical protein HDV00_005199 [Rhizophlyctis rosea]|nr:hypothetical protein HDV00_005199 [Rhizophlyctis rosea]